MTERYASKMARVLLALNRTVSVLIAETWLHQANGMRCVLEHVTPPTRLLFATSRTTRCSAAARSNAEHSFLVC